MVATREAETYDIEREPGWRAAFNDRWEPMFTAPRRLPSAGSTEAGPCTVVGILLDRGRPELEHIARRWGVPIDGSHQPCHGLLAIYLQLG